MIVIGHKDIPFESISFIDNIDDIKSTKSHSTILFDFHIDIVEHLYNNNIDFGCVTSSLEEVVILSNLGAKYIIVDDKEFAIKLQDIANHYMYDSKILVKVKTTSEIEWSLLNKIDGVILWEKLISHK